MGTRNGPNGSLPRLSRSGIYDTYGRTATGATQKNRKSSIPGGFRTDTYTGRGFQHGHQVRVGPPRSKGVTTYKRPQNGRGKPAPSLGDILFGKPKKSKKKGWF